MLTLTEEQTAKLFELLGLPPDTDPTDIDAILAVIADLVKQATEAPDGDTSKPSAVAAAAKRLGLEAIDVDTLTALRTDAAEGRRIKAAAAKAKVEGQVDDAIKTGKIAASRRGHWVTLIQADPGMADVLASIPNETAVPLTEVGHAKEPNDDFAEESAWFY
ncbi:hypothetical protein J8M97_20500 [Gordonia polyisoprenivorans]|uniref:phage protease n=1 Tax=Gordonia polyisoprenivorans TaxID=84595 RepID=UPI001B8C7FA6|nr:phage protease [Gordonia polyisoprenivorans]QUD82090.1 hypothetical protein J8M97_20500 [Gordonia polyisoprenivorans]